MKSWNDVRSIGIENMTAAEKLEYERGLADAEIALSLAQLVYDARKQAGLTQTELARRAGTTQSAISAIESTTKVPTVPTLYRVARALGTNLDIQFVPTTQAGVLINA